MKLPRGLCPCGPLLHLFCPAHLSCSHMVKKTDQGPDFKKLKIRREREARDKGAAQGDAQPALCQAESGEEAERREPRSGRGELGPSRGPGRDRSH